MVSGKVINLVSGKPVGGAKIRLSQRSGAAGTKIVRTGSKGLYSVRLRYGTWRAEITGAGFADSEENIHVGAEALNKGLMLSPKLKPGSMRFVLTWSHSPKDLDSYLRTPGGCTVWYRKRHCHTRGEKVHLDLDNTHGHGPETITVSKFAKSGKYTYCIKQYSRRGKLVDSSAIARIFFPSGKQKILNIGRAGHLRGGRGRGRTWLVVSVDAATHKISTPRSSDKCGAAPRRGFRRRRSSRRRRSRRRRNRRRRRRSRRRRFFG